MQVACNISSAQLIHEKSAPGFTSALALTAWFVCIIQHTGLRGRGERKIWIRSPRCCPSVSRFPGLLFSRSALIGSCAFHLNRSLNTRRRETIASSVRRKGSKLEARRGMHGHNRSDQTILHVEDKVAITFFSRQISLAAGSLKLKQFFCQAHFSVYAVTGFALDGILAFLDVVNAHIVKN